MSKTGTQALTLMMFSFAALAYAEPSAVKRAWIPEDPNVPYEGGEEKWVDAKGSVVSDEVAAVVLESEAKARQADIERKAQALVDGGIKVTPHDFFVNADSGEIETRPGFKGANHQEISGPVAQVAIRLQQQREEEARQQKISAEAARLLGGNCQRLIHDADPYAEYY